MFHVKHRPSGGTIDACRDLWKSLPANLGICPWDDALEKLTRLKDVLLGASRKRSLIAASQRNAAAIWEHVFDSLQALYLLDGKLERHVVDAGSGNGFPGLPLAAALPGVKLSLIERSARKAEFLQYAGAILSLKNVTVCQLDFADFDWLREPVDACLMRALVPPQEFASLVGDSGSLSRSYIIYTTRQAADEWAAQTEQLGLRIVASHSYLLPDRSACRQILRISTP